MNLQEIADTLNPENVGTYSQEYKKTRKEKPWLHDLLEWGYVALNEKVKIHTEKHEWLPWEPACNVMDKLVFTVCYIYERKLAMLEAELNECKRRLKSTD